MPDPRMLIAWLVLIILIALVIIVPIAAIAAMRARRRAIARFDAHSEAVRAHLRSKTSPHCG
jgi:hypothetical protein